MASEPTPATVEEEEAADVDADVRNAFVPTFGKYFPESLVGAILLAGIALVATVPSLESITQLELFGGGFYVYELFALHMLLILYWVLGASVVESPRVGAVLDRLADALPTSQAGVIYATAFVSLALGWVNWAFGLIGGVLVGQRLCRRARENGTAVHYPLVLTGGLLALVLANQGLSSPGALIAADDTGLTNVMVDDAGAIAMREFLFHPANLASSLIFALTLPLLLVWLAPDDEDEITTLGERNRILEGSIEETLEHYSPARQPADWQVGDCLENAETLTLVVVAIGLASLGWHFATGGGLTLPWLAFGLVVLGLLAQGPPMAFREKTEDATKWANHMAIPFLLYGAAFALLAEAELYGSLGDALAATGLPYVGSYVATFLVGLLVPDPGSVWLLHGPVVAAGNLEVVPALIAVMYASGVSNLWLAFLFASVLSLYGFDWREFASYAAVVTLYVSAVVLGLLLVF
ncbi:short chain fatty acid transporter [Natronococcus pandeyae]|uniref:Short chain fatty acid transporter n=1 Tax=Natronococcus pandeyae TaxID=2055836 RepID=A0A8J8Q7Z7_9EURY|nr:TIGR00366 family protein [Natronococcus pandeyae]TYL39404.1 short chain fatty acid transporter [Natronococcus pandeyae]